MPTTVCRKPAKPLRRGRITGCADKAPPRHGLASGRGDFQACRGGLA
jgi:hypothetical protein